MNRRTLSIALLIPFALLTLYALAIDGYMGILDHQLATPAGWQVLADLVVALLLVLTWLIPDARRSGRNPWPWVVLTLFMGSIGPLVYFALSGKSATTT